MEILVTRVVPAPCGVVRCVVESSLSTYLKLMHKMGILRFTEDQIIVTGWRKWFRGVSLILHIFISEVPFQLHIITCSLTLYTGTILLRRSDVRLVRTKEHQVRSHAIPLQDRSCGSYDGSNHQHSTRSKYLVSSVLAGLQVERGGSLPPPVKSGRQHVPKPNADGNQKGRQNNLNLFFPFHHVKLFHRKTRRLVVAYASSQLC